MRTKRKTMRGILVFLVMMAMSAMVSAQQTWYCGVSTNVGGAISVTATLTEDGTMTISGIGDMVNYSSSFSPWHYNRLGIKTVIIESGVTSIGNRAFYGCGGLTGELTVPNSVTSIGNRAFSGCSGLTEVTIPNSITSIGDGAFAICSGLTGELIIPNSVISIGDGAFSGCSGLTEVTIPNSVTSIGDYAFQYCSGLTEVTIPNSVTSIRDYAFYNCSGLTEITIPNSVTSIGSSAFSGCSGLTSLKIPAGASIGSYVFSGCDNLASLTISGTGHMTSSYLPNLTNLKILIIEDYITSIGSYVFFNCSSLTKIESLSATPPTVGNNAFYGVDKTNCTVYAPASSVETYKTTNGWKDFFNIREIGATPISKIQNSDNRFGIRFAQNIVSTTAEISVVLPNNERATQTNITVYDMTGNVVFVGATALGRPLTWDLRNSAGRTVSNGTYLVIAEVKAFNGQASNRKQCF